MNMGKIRRQDIVPVTRQWSTMSVRVSDADDSQTDDNRLRFTGLAVPFGVQTRIDNFFEGRFDEQFVRGAFKRTLGQKTPVLQFDHGYDYRFGSLPIGKLDNLTETDAGLEVEGTLFAADELEQLREALREGAIDGMSIRFRPMAVEVIDADARDDEHDEGVALHNITEADLRELGPVVFPAYPTTNIDARSLPDLASLTTEQKRRLAEALAVDLGNTNGSSTGRARPHAGSGSTDKGHPSATSNQRRDTIAAIEKVLNK